MLGNAPAVVRMANGTKNVTLQTLQVGEVFLNGPVWRQFRVKAIPFGKIKGGQRFRARGMWHKRSCPEDEIAARELTPNALFGEPSDVPSPAFSYDEMVERLDLKYLRR